MGVKLVFIEVQNNDPEFLNTQIEQELRKRFSHIDVGHMYRGMPIMIVQNDYRLKHQQGRKHPAHH